MVITDIDQARVDKGLAYIHAEVDKLLAKGRISPDAANRTKALVTGSVSKEAFADADFVIEAVFEELAVKKQVFAEVEAVVSPECILATNTSSLSVTEMAADLEHPERLVGFHFFNPVALMPLLEIVRAPKTDDAALATAFALAKALRKTSRAGQGRGRVRGQPDPAAPDGRDRQGLRRGHRRRRRRQRAAPHGPAHDPVHAAGHGRASRWRSTSPESLHAAFGERFHVSENYAGAHRARHQVAVGTHGRTAEQDIPASTLALLDFGNTPSTAEELLLRTQDALAAGDRADARAKAWWPVPRTSTCAWSWVPAGRCTWAASPRTWTGWAPPSGSTARSSTGTDAPPVETGCRFGEGGRAGKVPASRLRHVRVAPAQKSCCPPIDLGANVRNTLGMKQYITINAHPQKRH